MPRRGATLQFAGAQTAGYFSSLLRARAIPARCAVNVDSQTIYIDIPPVRSVGDPTHARKHASVQEECNEL